MPDFWYEALTPSGQVEKATMTATSEDDLAERLRETGAYLMRSRPAERVAPKKTDGKVPRKQLLALIEYMAGSAQVGMPIMTTLTDVEPRLESKRLRQIVAEMRNTMSLEGKSLSEAMREHPKAFDSFYVNTIEAGEASGQLDFVLDQLVKHLDWQETLGSQIRQAVTYPIIIVMAIIGLLLVLVGFVFPRLIPILTGRAVELPLATRIVIATSEIVRDFWLVGIVAAVGAGLLVVVAHKQEEIGVRMDAMLLRVPIFGPLILQINMARMVTYLALFYRTGIDIIVSLTLTANVVRNRAIARAVDNVRLAVTEGESLGTAFGASSIFPPIVMRSISLGEVTGHLDDALNRTSIYYEREVPAAVKRMVTALQPLLIVFMGGAVLLVALAIVLPILGIYDSIGRR